MKICVLGAGTWGVALARLLYNNGKGNEVIVWSPIQQEVDNLTDSRKHPNLPATYIPQAIEFTSNIFDAVYDRDIIVFATPSAHIKNTARLLQDSEFVNKDAIIVSVSKGIDGDTLKTPSQIIEAYLPHKKYVVLSGPTHAEEVVKELPTTIVAASIDLAACMKVIETFSNDNFKVFASPDPHGVEFCGAAKNAIALACGVATGAGYGDNTKAALIVKGMEEIVKIGEAMGYHQSSFYGLAGIGDLIVTATSLHSRNNRCGILIGNGENAYEAQKHIGMVVEGLNVIHPLLTLACTYRVKTPILEALWEVCEGKITAKDAKNRLMSL